MFGVIFWRAVEAFDVFYSGIFFVIGFVVIARFYFVRVFVFFFY